MEIEILFCHWISHFVIYRPIYNIKFCLYVPLTNLQFLPMCMEFDICFRTREKLLDTLRISLIILYCFLLTTGHYLSLYKSSFLFFFSFAIFPFSVSILQENKKIPKFNTHTYAHFKKNYYLYKPTKIQISISIFPHPKLNHSEQIMPICHT